MARYAFDIETNGLLDEMTTIHSLVLQDVDTGDVISADPRCGGKYIEDALYQLKDADQIIGHNIIAFDIPAIQKVYPWFTIDEDKVFDTLVASRIIWSDLMDRDVKAVKQGKLPAHRRGSHSLEAWGYRLGHWKGDYSKEMKEKGLDPWAEWNEDMQRYCEQDVVVTVEFLKLVESKHCSPQALELEHKVAFIITEQEHTGFCFDIDGAHDLVRKLQEERAAVSDEMALLFDPWYVFKETVTPKRTVNYKDKSRHSVTAGCPYTKIELKVFNPGSRAHISDRLKKVFGWQPTDFTPKGQPKIDDEILSALPWPQAKRLAYYLMLQKRIGQVAEGKNSWLNSYNEKTQRIHGSVNPGGALGGRMTHSSPNVAQTPSVGVPFGPECRSLWTVPSGRKLVGVDVSGLELRMLGHYMARHDGGAYAREVIEGDIHTANMEAAGLPSRDMAKTFIYGFLYGAGNEKIGSIVGKGSAHGGKLKKRFLEATPALNDLIRGVSKSARTKGYIKGLDGRIIMIRHQHAALNTLLQSAGALVCKQWAVECEAVRRDRGLQDKVKYVANIHDEIQFEVDEDFAEEWAKIAVDCIVKAGEHFNLRVPLTGDANIGNNWKETH